MARFTQRKSAPVTHYRIAIDDRSTSTRPCGDPWAARMLFNRACNDYPDAKSLRLYFTNTRGIETCESVVSRG